MDTQTEKIDDEKKSTVDFNEMERRLSGMKMDVYTGEMIPSKQN